MQPEDATLGPATPITITYRGGPYNSKTVQLTHGTLDEHTHVALPPHAHGEDWHHYHLNIHDGKGWAMNHQGPVSADRAKAINANSPLSH